MKIYKNALGSKQLLIWLYIYDLFPKCIVSLLQDREDLRKDVIHKFQAGICIVCFQHQPRNCDPLELVGVRDVRERTASCRHNPGLM